MEALSSSRYSVLRRSAYRIFPSYRAADAHACDARRRRGRLASALRNAKGGRRSTCRLPPATGNRAMKGSRPDGGASVRRARITPFGRPEGGEMADTVTYTHGLTLSACPLHSVDDHHGTSPTLSGPVASLRKSGTLGPESAKSRPPDPQRNVSICGLYCVPSSTLQDSIRVPPAPYSRSEAPSNPARLLPRRTRLPKRSPTRARRVRPTPRPLSR